MKVNIVKSGTVCNKVVYGFKIGVPLGAEVVKRMMNEPIRHAVTLASQAAIQ